MKNLQTENWNKFNDGTTYRMWRTCACGCGQVVRNIFAQGHDMRVKAK